MNSIKLADPALLRARAHVDGRWVAADDGETFPVHNPATGALLGVVPRLGAAETQRAIAAAAAAWPAWRARTADDRAALLRRWHAAVLAAAEDLAQLMTAEQGKPLAEARGEVQYAAAYIDWYAEEARRINGQTLASPLADRRLLVLREPIGVCAAITPWNFPLAMITRKVAPALAAGNPIIVKPAEATPLSALALAVLAERAGLPPGVLQVITGEGVPVGSGLVEHPDIRLVSLTGDIETGKLIAANAAKTLKRVHLELGGKAPMVVLDDADPEAVAEAIKIGGYWNSGQDCTASSRILVSERIYDDVLAQTKDVIEAMKVGDPADGDDVEMGPVISEEQRARILGFMERLPGSATIVTGGEVVGDRGFFVKPTIVTDVSQDDEIVQREVFGPVVTMQRFASDDEALAMANGTRYGLAASVFSKDVGRALAAAKKLEFGTVWVNEHLFPLASEMPHGGFKESGYGKDMSAYSMEEYTRIKHVAVKLA
jgi:acyl-CoA reductase-like NAD-dependent aldehyde dehydrogenase